MIMIYNSLFTGVRSYFLAGDGGCFLENVNPNSEGHHFANILLLTAQFFCEEGCEFGAKLEISANQD